MQAKDFTSQIYSAEAVTPVMEFLKAWDFGEGGVDIKIQAVSDRMPYLAVFWIWMRQLADNFSARGKKTYTAQDIHDLLCHKFLGYTPERTIGKTVIKSALITLTYPEPLKGHAFGELLTKIEVWAIDVNVQLKTQAKSEYMEYKEANL